MPHARYKVKCALCRKTFDNDNKGASLQRGSIQTTHRGQYYGSGKTSEFLILACEKDLTDLIDLEDVTMSSGDLKGGPRGPWLQVKRFW